MENFDIIKKIGEGTYSKVYLARHIITGFNVAIKSIGKHRLLHKKDRMMVQKQIAILKDISHQNICELYELFEDNEYIYIVMEYMEKDSLLEYLKSQNKQHQIQQLQSKKPIDRSSLISAKIQMFIDIVKGVKHLHQKRIAHRDIKLANILINQQNKLKIADFGLSTYYSPQSLLKTSCGSPCFAAPQILLGINYIPQKVDVWSLGVVFYCMLAGTFPFYDEQIKKIYKKVCAGKYRCPDYIPKNVQLIIAQIFDTLPETRINLQDLYQKLLKIRLQNRISTKKFLKQNTTHNLSQNLQQRIKIRTYENCCKYFQNLNYQQFQKYYHNIKQVICFNSFNTTIKLYHKKSHKQVLQQSKLQNIKENNNILYQSLNVDSRNTTQVINKLKRGRSPKHSQNNHQDTDTSYSKKTVMKNIRNIRSPNKNSIKLLRRNKSLQRNISQNQHDNNNRLSQIRQLKRSIQIPSQNRKSSKIVYTNSRTNSPKGYTTDTISTQKPQRYIKISQIIKMSSTLLQSSQILTKQASSISTTEHNSKQTTKQTKRQSINLSEHILEVSKSQQQLNLIKNLKYLPFVKKTSNTISNTKHQNRRLRQF